MSIITSTLPCHLRTKGITISHLRLPVLTGILQVYLNYYRTSLCLYF